MEKQIKLTVVQAKNLYILNPEYRDTLLSVFTDKELGIKNPYPKNLSDLSDLTEINGFWIDSDSNIETFNSEDFVFEEPYSNSVFATEKQAKSALAFAQLSQLAKEMNGDWIADWNESFKVPNYCIIRTKSSLVITSLNVTFYSIAFKTKEMAEFSLKHHEQLWKDYYELD